MFFTVQKRQRAVVRVSCRSACFGRSLGGLLTLLVAAMAMLSSNGCQLMCKIFLLKSIWSASVSLRIRCPWPAAGLPALEPPFLPPLAMGLVDELMGVGTPTFLALNADLSAWSTTSTSFS